MHAKKKKRLVFMTVLVMLLGLGYLAEDHLLDVRQERMTIAEEKAQEQLAILSIAPEEISELRFKGDDGDIIFRKDGENWTAPEDGHFIMDPSAAARLEKDLRSLTATRVLADETDLSRYGLDPARQTVTIRMADGSETGLYIGDRSDSSHELYAATSADKGKVFLTKAALDEHFSGTLGDFALYEDAPGVKAERIRSIRVEKESDSFTLYTPGDDTCTVTDENGKSEGADLTAAGTVLYLLEDLDWLYNLEYHAADPETLGKYGLDHPACTIEVSAEGDGQEDGLSYTLLTGASDENGNYYVKLAGSDQVHSVRREYLASLVEGKALNFWSLAFSFVSMSDLDYLDVSRSGGTWTLQYESGEGSSRESSSESAAEEEGSEKDSREDSSGSARWLVDHNEVSKDSFTAFYYACVSVTAQERLSEVPAYEQDPDLTLTYYLKDGSVKELKYYLADQNFYTVVYDDGNKAASVNRIYVKGMLDALDHLLSGA